MKKAILAFGVCFIIIGLCSCKSAYQPETVSSTADNDVRIVYDDQNYEGHLTVVNENTASLTVSSPENLKGITFRRADGADSAELGSLNCKSDGRLFHKGSLASEVMDIFDTIRTAQREFIGKTSDGNYEFSYGEGEDRLKVKTDGQGIVVSAENDKITLQIINQNALTE